MSDGLDAKEAALEGQKPEPLSFDSALSFLRSGMCCYDGSSHAPSWCLANDAMLERCAQAFEDALREASAKQREVTDAIPMLLWCPACQQPHFDRDEWATRPHRTHKCENCGNLWRPALVPTVGVAALSEEPR